MEPRGNRMWTASSFSQLALGNFSVKREINLGSDADIAVKALKGGEGRYWREGWEPSSALYHPLLPLLLPEA